MNSLIERMNRRVTAASENPGQNSCFQIPFPNGVTVHLEKFEGEHHVGYMTYLNASEPMSKPQYVSVYDDAVLVDRDENAKIDFHSISMLAAFIECASQLSF